MEQTKLKSDREREIWLSFYNSYIRGVARNIVHSSITEGASEIADQGLEEYRKRHCN